MIVQCARPKVRAAVHAYLRRAMPLTTMLLPMMRVVCAWCSADMGEKPGDVGLISHGLCCTCAARLADEDAGVGR